MERRELKHLSRQQEEGKKAPKEAMLSLYSSGSYAPENSVGEKMSGIRYPENTCNVCLTSFG